MPKAFSEQEKKIIVQRLLEHGARQFASAGLKKTTVEELAGAAGISKAAFYLFYESKESLFMDVVEQAETAFRLDILSAVDLPGPSPRTRLCALLKRAFTHWQSVPLLQVFTRGDYELVLRRVPPEKVQEHLDSDARFFRELIDRCREAGIPIQIDLALVGELFYTLFFMVLHQDDLGVNHLTRSMDTLIELIAAFLLGEIRMENPAEEL